MLEIRESKGNEWQKVILIDHLFCTTTYQKLTKKLLTLNKTVLVCQNRSCKSRGSARVLKAFQASAIPNTEVVGSGCLGQCGNGSMVLILPEEIWYDRVAPNEVKTLVEQHLLQGQPVKSMLYRVKHP